jgi:hypothetical protein
MQANQPAKAGMSLISGGGPPQQADQQHNDEQQQQQQEAQQPLLPGWHSTDTTGAPAAAAAAAAAASAANTSQALLTPSSVHSQDSPNTIRSRALAAAAAAPAAASAAAQQQQQQQLQPALAMPVPAPSSLIADVSSYGMPGQAVLGTGMLPMSAPTPFGHTGLTEEGLGGVRGGPQVHSNHLENVYKCKARNQNWADEMRGRYTWHCACYLLRYCIHCMLLYGLSS